MLLKEMTIITNLVYCLKILRNAVDSGILEKKIVNPLTKYFQFTKFVKSVCRVSSGIVNSSESLVVVDDVLSMNKTRCFKNSWNGA